MNIMILRKLTLHFICFFIAFFGTISLHAQDTLKLDIQSKAGEKGTTVCIDVTAENFKSIESIQFNLSYNATLVVPQCPATNVHPGLKNNIFGDLFNCGTKGAGYLNFVWASDPTTIADGQVLFTLCFDIIGEPGNVSPVSINGSILTLEVCREVAGRSVCIENLNTNTGTITIKSNSLLVFTNKCDADGVNNIENASLTFYATGGTAPYSYTINGAEFTGNGLLDGQRVTLSNIPQKTYEVIITDANNLKVTKSIVISNGQTLTYDKSKKDPTCSDRPNGTIKISNKQGGFAPFTYEWSNLISGVDSLKDLRVGKYTVTITDFNGCKKIDSFQLSRAALIMDVKIKNNAPCNQPGIFGNIEITASGGTPWTIGDPFRFILNSGLNFRFAPPYLFSVRAGNFTVRVSDSLGCSTDIRSFTMPFDRALDMTAAVKDVTCKGAKDGSVTMTVSPYSTFNTFFPLAGSPDIGGLGTRADTLKLSGISPGNYAYRMIDFNNCRDTVRFNITEPDSLKLNPVVVQPQCDIFGSIKLKTSGGKGGYTYSWNPIQSGNTDSLTNLTGGTFKVTVSDFNRCKDSFSVTLNQQGTLNIVPKVVKDITCNGAKNGSLSVEINSGNGPFDIKWKDGSGAIISTFQTMLNVGSGTYTVQVTDKNNCSSFPLTISITEPAPFFLTLSFSNAICNKGNGQSLANVVGGNSGFTFEWQKLGNPTIIDGDNLLNAPSGQYIVSAINVLGCRKSDTITISEPDSIRFNTIITQAKCDTLGSITVNPSGGSAGYRYAWSLASVDTTNMIKNLAGGIYTVTVTDAANCTSTLTQTINQQAKPDIAPQAKDISCFGSKDGSLSVNITSSNGPFSILWTDSLGTNVGITQTVLNVGGGKYNIKVTDKNNCPSVIKQVTVVEPSPLILVKNVTNAICFQQQGKAIVNVQGGNGGFLFEWRKEGNPAIIDRDSSINVTAGKYFITVQNANGCKKIDSITISEPLKISFPVPQTRNVTCIGFSNGQAVIFNSPSGLNYTWSTGIVAPFSLNFPAGPAWVVAKDNNNCVSDTLFFNIGTPSGIKLDVAKTIVLNPRCFGEANGSVSVLATGGTGSNYNYSWAHGPSGSSIAGQKAGKYYVTIRDSINCSVTDSISLSEPPALSVSVDNSMTVNPNCNNINGGKIGIMTSGGNPGLKTIKWQSGVIVDNGVAIGLNAGIYCTTVSDVLGCQAVFCDTLVQPLKSVTTNIALDKTISCNGLKDASLSVTITGNNVPSNTLWSDANGINIGSNPIIQNLGPGKYYVLIIEQNSEGCRKLDSITVQDPPIVTLPAAPQTRNVSCFGLSTGQATVIGAVPGLIYTWSSGTKGMFAADLNAGQNWLFATNANNCKSDTTFFNIGTPSGISLNAANTIVSNPRCFGEANGSVSITAMGGTGSKYNYSWAHGPSGSFIANLKAGKYYVTIRDSLNCALTDSISLAEPSALTASGDNSMTVNPNCNNLKGGKIGIMSSGGNPGLKTIKWQTGVIADNGVAIGLNSGIYCATISDVLGCQAVFCDTLDQQLNIVNTNLTVNKTISCNGLKDANLSVSVTTGNGVPFNTLWSNTNGINIGSNPVIQGLGAGKYYVLIIEQNSLGCRKLDSITLQDPPKVTFPTPSTRNVTCFGLSTGQATIIGATPGLTFTWSSGTKGMFAADLNAGPNWVFANNSNTCKSDTTFFNIGTFPLLSIDDAKTLVTNPTCFGSTNGSATITAKGGTGLSYIYSWANGTTGTSLNNIGAGQYIVTINDSNNCQQTDTVTITQPGNLVASVDNNKTIELDCKNTNVGKIGIITTGGNPGVKTITWQSGLTVENGVATGLKQGNYCATVSDNFGCKDTFCYSLASPPKIRGEINNPAPPLCNGGTTCISVKSITGGTGNKYTFQINNGKRFPIDSCVTVTAGQYFVAIIDSTGCSTDTLITINQPIPIAVDLGPDVEIQLGQKSTLLKVTINSPSNIDSIQWTPTTGLTCLSPDCITLEANPTESTTYLISVTDANGCRGSDEVTISVKNVRNVYFSNIFSPNRDGVNDYFQAVTGAGVEEILSFSIFDRWGNQVYEKSAYIPDPAGSDGWDGTFNGKRLDPGVFVYFARAKFIDGKVIDYSGSVTLADKVRN